MEEDDDDDEEDNNMKKYRGPGFGCFFLQSDCVHRPRTVLLCSWSNHHHQDEEEHGGRHLIRFLAE